ncbi:hypothetical protein [Nocardia salmonicida]|uniref:hypothetical protein n=1 Tax=Nocardia salmonicida TaxID=53431 RepID=UPI0033C93CED
MDGAWLERVLLEEVDRRRTSWTAQISALVGPVSQGVGSARGEHPRLRGDSSALVRLLAKGTGVVPSERSCNLPRS